jgi:hypothetical protein
MATDADTHAEDEDDEIPRVPDGVIEGVEDARDGDFATEKSLRDALFPDE